MQSLFFGGRGLAIEPGEGGPVPPPSDAPALYGGMVSSATYAPTLNATRRGDTARNRHAGIGCYTAW